MKLPIPKDEMTPLERMNAFSKGQALDRIPICPFNGESFSNYFGYSLNKFNHDTDTIVEVVVKTFKRFRTDNCSIGPGLHGLAEAMGCQLKFYDKQIPQIISSPLKSYTDLSFLKEIDPKKDGRLNLYLEALKRIQKEVGHQVSIGSTVCGPFTTAGLLIGTDRFMRDLVKDSENVIQIIEMSCHNTLKIIKALLDLGITPGMADPLASSHLISKKTYDRFVLPYTKICQDYIKKHTGSGGVLHICGKTKPIWSSMIKSGISAISLDNCDDIKELKLTHEKEICLVGNVDPVNSIYLGDKESIYSAVKECCEKARGAYKGFVLATGCDVPIGSRPEAIDHFIAAGKIYGNER